MRHRGVVLSIDEQKRAEEDLRAREAHLRSILDTVPEASRCRLMPSYAQEISAPRTSRSPLGSASSASDQPRVVSWSVSATTSRPAAAAGAHQVGRAVGAVRGGAVGVEVDAHRASLGAGRRPAGQTVRRGDRAPQGTSSSCPELRRSVRTKSSMSRNPAVPGHRTAQTQQPSASPM